MSTYDPDPIATPEQQRAHRRHMGQRLRDQAERLLRGFEALPDPQTVIEAERTAKALKAVDAVITQICGADMRAPESEDEIVAEQTALATWLPILDRRLAHQAQMREAMTPDGITLSGQGAVIGDTQRWP